ncbi:hypothetical protein [Pleurocapsa sp. PCC 7319]|uniref:hypothetical protein n=1 Tax=Pleurocapsa sp. PCC 7319 TaxID=118161 RepID=UPI00034C016B|nr:hypothetical protein [Pleurocapsa sp. PCC 7319]
MTSSEDFKQAIRTGNISEAFLVAMSNAPKLDITTKIISNSGKTRQINANQSPVDNYLRTHINLIEGKIENEIGEQFAGDRYSEIKQFHIEQVTQGHQTIQHNLVSLQKMFHLMSAFQQQQENAGQSSWVDIAADVTRESLPAKPETNQLSGNKSPEALVAGKAVKNTARVSSEDNLDVDTDQLEPKLPSFVPEDEDDSVVDDLLSLADIDDDDDDDAEDEKHPQAEQGDWGDWLEDEPEGKQEVFDLKSLNIRNAAQNWQNWESQHHGNSQPSTEQAE